MEKEREREPIQPMDNRLRFINIRPGGNDTSLVVGIPDTPEKRRQINAAIQSIYRNIEQVGFIDLNRENLILEMAGGEFCGNATRSAAWLALQGQPGVIDITASGVSGQLRAGVTEESEAFAQMPVYPDPNRIVQDPTSPRNVTVAMEGITHYIDFAVEKIEGLSADEIKYLARAELARRGLDQEAAAGIMYAKRTDAGWKITPVVYVRDIDTLFLETACGSGTTAMGLALAKQMGESINELPIIQPSGLPIKVSVDYDGEQFGYTQIQGPIEALEEGALETNKIRAYAIEQVANPEQLSRALQERGLREAYADAFGRPPYNEKFTDQEIDAMFIDYLRDGRVFVAVADGQIIAFSAIQPLESVPEVGELLTGRDGIDNGSWYIPELGIRKEYEGTGIAKQLMIRALEATPASTITLRTNADNARALNLYRSLGFTVVPELFQQISRERLIGETQTDIRIFMTLQRGLEKSLTIPPLSTNEEVIYRYEQ